MQPHALRFYEEDISDGQGPLPFLDLAGGSNSDASVQTDPLPSSSFSKVVLIFSKILDVLQRVQQDHGDSTPTRAQVAQLAAALKVLLYRETSAQRASTRRPATLKRSIVLGNGDKRQLLVQCFKEGTTQEDPCRISCFGWLCDS